MPHSDDKTLMAAAAEASQRAYARYSNYPVGAAVLAADGTVYRGCNIENASFGLTVCAERTAVFSAVADGVDSFEVIAIATRDAGAPCGACRQVINEFAPDARVLIGNLNGEIVRQYERASDLLPDAFGPHNVSE